MCEAICALTSVLVASLEQRKIEFDWLRSHAGLATKQDLKEMERRIMAAYEDLKSVLGEINGTTNEIASDLDELIAKLSQPGGLTEAQAQEIVSDLSGHSTTLKNVAAKYPAPPA